MKFRTTNLSAEELREDATNIGLTDRERRADTGAAEIVERFAEALGSAAMVVAVRRAEGCSSSDLQRLADEVSAVAAGIRSEAAAMVDSERD